MIKLIKEMLHTASRLWVTIVAVVTHHDIQCKVPPSTVFSHGAINVVISHDVKLGNHIIIGQNVTIGKRNGPGVPIIEDYVVISPHSIIVGDIRICHHSIIGAGAVVINNVPPYSVVVGNPAHVIHTICNAFEYKQYRDKRK